MNGKSIDDFTKLSTKYNIPEIELTLKYYFEYRMLHESRLYSEEMCCFTSMERVKKWCKEYQGEKK